MIEFIAKRICRVCEMGNPSVNNVLFMTLFGVILLVPEQTYWEVDDGTNIWLATLNIGERFVGYGAISPDEHWVGILADECINKMRRRKMI